MIIPYIIGGEKEDIKYSFDFSNQKYKRNLRVNEMYIS